MTALLQAALRGNAAVVGMLLAADADPAVCDSWCRTALHLAAGGYVETDVSAVPDTGFPTAPNANLAAVRILLRARVDPQAEDAEGRLPVEYAAARSHTKVAALLSERPRREDGA
uniref:Ankyrin repeat domain-containing protein n=1 Tax=Alexandrium monilatum TaxID=311494 RepID=A0A7S4RGW6_9DINO|mmetsp:Transcript_64245/g.203078  ORF Transcript_64245/g.203078 Transcript_64245/m.203078 type:complete len:115 (+) Transcript_64245:2-346(+)